MPPARRVLIGGLIASTTVLTAAQQPKLDGVVSRLGLYLEDYEQRLSLVVAEERYHQSFDLIGPSGQVRVDVQAAVLPIGHHERLLRSDYVLTRAPDKEAWVGYRDTFEVDGKPIRDREDRLQRLLMTGGAASAARIADESSRFNLGNAVVTRNINVPTLVLEMLHPRNQARFSFNKAGEEMIAGVRTWRLEFKERQRPTFIRDQNRRDRPTHGSIWVDPDTGAVWRTTLTWDSAPKGTIIVTYGRVPNIDALVPLTMTERYSPGEATLTGDAAYTNYRQFQTGARLIENGVGGHF
jgi:hypothetical protein